MRGKLRFNVGGKRLAIHRPFNHLGSNQGVLGEPGDKGLGVPAAKGSFVISPLSLRSSCTQPCQVGFDTGFINKHSLFWHTLHERLTCFKPLLSCLAHITQRSQTRLYSQTMAQEQSQTAPEGYPCPLDSAVRQGASAQG